MGEGEAAGRLLTESDGLDDEGVGAGAFVGGSCDGVAHSRVPVRVMPFRYLAFGCVELPVPGLSWPFDVSRSGNCELSMAPERKTPAPR